MGSYPTLGGRDPNRRVGHAAYSETPSEFILSFPVGRVP